jgi:hypothetical protein
MVVLLSLVRSARRFESLCDGFYEVYYDDSAKKKG